MFGLLARVAPALLVGLGLSQSAEFAQQYLQRLGGAVDELRTVVERFDATAGAENLTRQEALDRLARNADPIAVRQGESAAAALARFDAVSRRYDELLRTTPLFRPFAMLADPDGAIIERAAGDFRPAVPVTPDGFLLAFFGFVGGWAGGAGAAGTVRRVVRRRRAVRASVGREPAGS